MPQPSEITLIGQLVLVRLLPGGDRGVTQKMVAKDVGQLVAHRSSGASWTENLDRVLAHLEAESALFRPKKGQCLLTPKGRQQALEFLGIEQLAPKTTWATLKKKELLARLLGLPVPTGESGRRFALDTGLKAALLKQCLAIPIGEDFPTLPRASEALAWKLLGFDSLCHQKFTLKAVQNVLLSRALNGERVADPKKGVDLLLAKEIGARSAKDVRAAAMRLGLDRALSADPSEPAGATVDGHPSLDLGSFAERVVSAARSSPTGRFGDNKVFIAHVWRGLRHDPAIGLMDLPSFKQRLAEASHARLLDLSRADLVEAMNTEDVRESELEHYGATFHFIRI